jgi:hypothetical protein
VERVKAAGVELEPQSTEALTLSEAAGRFE